MSTTIKGFSLLDGANCIENGISEDHATSLINNLKLELQARGKEYDFKYVGNIKNLITEVVYKKNQYNLEIRGAFSKFLNGENVTPITWEQVNEIINKVNEILRIDVSKIHKSTFIPVRQLDFSSFLLSRLELKVDIEVGVDMPYMQRFLKTNLIQHKNKPFTCEDGLTYQCKHEHYHMKVYCKGENLLRMEMVFLTRELKKYKIRTPSDLTKEKLFPMGERMKKEFSEVIMGDGINLFLADDLTKKEEVLLLRYTNQWRHNCYSETLKSIGQTDSRKYKKRMARLKTSCLRIFNQKGSGIRRNLIEALDNQIDQSFS